MFGNKHVSTPPHHLQHEQTPPRPHFGTSSPPSCKSWSAFLGASKGCLVPKINQPSRKSCFSNTPPGYCLVRLAGFQFSNLESDVLKKTENGIFFFRLFFWEFYGTESFGQFDSCPTRSLAGEVCNSWSPFKKQYAKETGLLANKKGTNKNL